MCEDAACAGSLYLPEVVNLAVDERLVLPLDVVDVLDVAGVEVLLHHKAQEAVVWCVSCGKRKDYMYTSLHTHTCIFMLVRLCIHSHKTWYLEGVLASKGLNILG